MNPNINVSITNANSVPVACFSKLTGLFSIFDLLLSSRSLV